MIKKWSKHSHPSDKVKLIRNCMKALVFDGNWKVNRLKCAFSNVVLPNIHFGPLPTGCINSPERKSYYCSDPKHAKNQLIFFNGYEPKTNKPKYLSLLPKQIKKTRLVRNENVTTIYDSFINQLEEELFLCDTTLETNKWIRRDQIRPLQKLSDFIDSRFSSDDLACKTDKSLAYTCELKVRTRGLQICASNCGIIMAYREMFLSESKHQVAIMYIDIADHFNGIAYLLIYQKIIIFHFYLGDLPEYLIYDDACHLKKFVESRVNNTEKTKIFKTKKLVVDKLHIQGHVDHRCLQECHPNKFQDLEEVNTVIVEQINFWFGRYKYILKHMNMYRYNFFLFILFDQYNTLAQDGKFSLIETVAIEKSDAVKRKRDELDEDDIFVTCLDELFDE
jgi:hypothetical protein